MRQYQNLKNSILELNNTNRFDTSLMIPERFIKIVKVKRVYHGSMRKLLHFLIINHGVYLKHKSKLRQNVLTKYQDENQALVKCNFMPDSRDWLALKSMANHLGVSASYLFVILLKYELEILKKVKNKLTLYSGTPVNLQTFELFSKIIFEKNNQYLLFSRFKIR